MRIAGIRFINALPLIYGLEKNPLHQIFLETPSVCYKKLLNREVDLALIPIFGTQLLPRFKLFGDSGSPLKVARRAFSCFARRHPIKSEMSLPIPHH